jgi:hypothetical protein
MTVEEFYGASRPVEFTYDGDKFVPKGSIGVTVGFPKTLDDLIVIKVRFEDEIGTWSVSLSDLKFVEEV